MTTPETAAHPLTAPIPYPQTAAAVDMAWVCEYIVDADADTYCVGIFPFAHGALFMMASDIDPYALYFNNSQFSCQLRMRASSVLDINTPAFVLVPTTEAVGVANSRRAALSSAGKLSYCNFESSKKKK